MVWDLHLKQDMDKIVRIQRNAARFSSGDSKSIILALCRTSSPNYNSHHFNKDDSNCT